MFFILGGIGILAISFVIALISMMRERGKATGQTVAPAPLQEAIIETEQFPKNGESSLKTHAANIGGQKILHPKSTTTIGVGLRTSLNGSVSVRDLKRQG